MAEYETKDSGQRAEFSSGMVRDVSTSKLKTHLTAAGPMFLRWAGLLTRGAAKYEENNWMKANGQEELDRFLESAYRHFMQWYYWRKFGVHIDPSTDNEDHGAATFFNINGAEYVIEKLEQPQTTAEAVAASLRRQLEDVPALVQNLPGAVPPNRRERVGPFEDVVIPLDEPSAGLMGVDTEKDEPTEQLYVNPFSSSAEIRRPHSWRPGACERMGCKPCDDDGNVYVSTETEPDCV